MSVMPRSEDDVDTIKVTNPNAENIKDAQAAYAQIPLICSLLFGFAAQTSTNPCPDCDAGIAKNMVVILLYMTLTLSFVGILIHIADCFLLNSLVL